MTVEILSRIQFAFTLTFHYIYVPLSIGLSIALIMMEAMYLKTKDPIWKKTTRFWIKVFAITFLLGVVTGIPLQFSIGANWSRYSRFMGDVLGNLLGAEGLFAFMIEAGFLGLLLFGWNRISHKVHLFATFMVSLGAHMSAVWIVAANSWMQYPTGFKLVRDSSGEMIAQVTNWMKMFLSPLYLTHLTHVLLGAWLGGSFLVISIASYYFLKKRHLEVAKKSMKVGLLIAGFAVISQLISADVIGSKVAKYNPVKLAAFEGVFKTEKSTPAYVVGWVDTEKEKVYGLKIPGLLSLLVYHDFTTPVEGLNNYSKDQWPWVNAVFQVYHAMVLSWGAMFITWALGAYYWIRKKKINKWILRLMLISVVFPQIGNLAGWYSSCMGRQPWTVYKQLKTKDAFTPHLSKMEMYGSLTMFVAMYLLLFALFCFILYRRIKKGPEEEDKS